MDTNLEARARAICELDLRSTRKWAEGDISAMINRDWPSVAAEILGGAVETGRTVNSVYKAALAVR